jgi:hypothetical protein
MAAVNTPLRTLIDELKLLLINPDIVKMTSFFIKKMKQTGGRGIVESRPPEIQMLPAPRRTNVSVHKQGYCKNSPER